MTDLWDRGSFTEAAAFVRRLGAARPGEPLPILLQALIHTRQADARTARELIERAMDLTSSPGSDSLALASMIFRELGDTTQAISYGLRATTLKPHDWQGYVALARAAAAEPLRGQQHEAERAARRAVALAPGEATAYLALGEALLAYPPQRIGTRKEGVEALERAAGLAPGNAEIQKALAEVRPAKDGNAWLGCLALPAMVALFVAGHRVIEMAGDGIARLLQIDQNRPEGEHSFPGLLILVVMGAVVWILVRLVRIKRRGDRPQVAIGRRKALSRNLHLADEESLRIAAATAATVVCMVPLILTGSLAAEAAAGTPLSADGALLPLVGVVALSVVGWSAVRWWFGPGQVQRALRVSGILRGCLLTSYVIVIGTVLLSWAEVSDEAAWTALMVLHFVWFTAGLGPLIIGARLARRRGRSGRIPPE
ncbi:hypothetical protein GT755_27200 [Herbidospora sp. NEAU-GS84]|uniref:Uncharacterized protein n=1 Tax=Herbidospora solisilvae TaxID=2696284 RepID=A0A7C9JYH0_9ACTN|nr:hypothetical protein [Herbidospora solisilvae]NAS25359.1 hypothetical protein [Herbidospora solisilvae]